MFGLRRNAILGTAGLIVALLVSSQATAESIKANNCKITFSTTGSPVLVKIEGKSEAPCQGQVNVDGGAFKDGSFTLDLNKLDTGVRLRNKHLTENYLKTAQHPTATLKLTSLDKLAEQRSGSAKAPAAFKGELSLVGQFKPIDGTYQISGKKVTANLAIVLQNWGIEQPSFMGVKVVEKVSVVVEFDI